MKTRIPTTVLALGLLAAGPAAGGISLDSGVGLSSDEDVGPASGKAETPDNVLPWAYFQALIDEEDALVVDVREAFLGDPLPARLATARPIPLEIFLANFVARGANRDKTLLIFDESGRSLPRLQRALEENGYRDFYFLAGGIERTLRQLGPGS
jgi:rhodanese-related sulfurtransferase